MLSSITNVRQFMNQSSCFPAVETPSSDAIFSPCRRYRYVLWRRWANDWSSNYAMFVGLNPSTADETQDDPTIRRCIKFAKDWGYSGLCMTNLFAYRATNPKDMIASVDPIGSDNDKYLLEYSARARIVVAAWGNHGTHHDRHLDVKKMLPNLYCLRRTKRGMPWHPLYLPQTLHPIQF
ncbi:DUF1643 domain-containing protein [Leptolyngbya boryana CZ1]|uniref:DUF1643 domain-containing protein n=2 Tax=Leptolyngbya TaxID=47251 RepID=A0AA97AYJ8_LEPBY|nr:DUF1643 domain-containing protein [Leptolyngbya boryana]WNZ48461.1 DUF1643 domain-containing protein [Leptolyngbya boryana CZ1]